MDPIELVFAKEDGLDITMDVFIPQRATEVSQAPVLLWWHGGGLLQGTRKALTPHLASCPEKHGLCLISADYRLAPQTRLPGILADCKSAIDFIRSPTFAKATGNRVDTSKLVVSGSSAGGFLALLAGTGIGYTACGLKPPSAITGIAAIYPITDLEDSFWKTKQHPVSYMDRVIGHEEVVPFIDPSDVKVAFSTLDSKRSIFYHYMIQEALLPSLLLDGTGIPPGTFSIAPQLRSGGFTAPSTYITHGTIDDKVPPRQSTDVVAAMEEKGIPTEFESFEGLDHRFDVEAKYEMEKMYAFIAKLIK